MKSPRERDAQHDPGSRDGIERRFGARNVERERLFHQDVLAGGCGLLDLRAVLTMRRRKDDRIDRRVGKDLVETLLQRDPVFAAKRLGRSAGAVIAGGKTDRAALSLDGIDEGSAPAADAHNGRADHFFAASMSRTPRSAR